MPPAHGENDERNNYDTRFKSKRVSLEDVLAGENVALSWLGALGPQYRCNKLLDTGNHTMSSLMTVAKRYPRVLIVTGGQWLLCCKVDDMELCSYKWMKKLVSITRMRRLPRPSFALGNTVEIAVEFDEISSETGTAFEETFSFAKAFEADRFSRELDEARRTARKARLEEVDARAARSAPMAAPVAVPPVVPPKPSSPASAPKAAAAFDASGDFGAFASHQAAPAPAAPRHLAPVDLFGPPRSPPLSLLDAPSLPPSDPFGFASTPPSPSSPSPLRSMAPLQAALPAFPKPPLAALSSPTSAAKLGSTPRRPSDPFALLVDEQRAM